MRVGLLLCGLALSLPADAPAQPESILYTATVTQAEALVRSLPSDVDKAYPTNALRRGAVVQVVKEEANGWLCILPPPGSFSWINKRYVHQPSPNNPTWVVTTGRDDKADVLIGSEVKKDDKRPDNRGAALSRGAIVVSIGPAQVDDEGAWLPIEPPPGEHRFIRAEAVTRNQGAAPTGPLAGSTPFNQAQPATVAANPTAFSGNTFAGNLAQPTLNIPGNSGGGAAQGTIEQLYGQAVQADRAGNYSGAIALYTQVGVEGKGRNHDLAMQALNRAAYLRQLGYGPTGQSPAVRPAEPAPSGGTGSRFTPARSESNPDTSHTSSTGGFPFRTGVGVLRFSNQRVLENRKVYLMMTRDGQPIAYVTPGYNVDLEQYLNREVELFGQAVFRSDLKTNLMVVERVQIGR